MLEEYGIKKDLLKTLASSQEQMGVTIQMVKDGKDVELTHQQFCAVIGLLKKACETQFIHLLRNDIEKRTEEMDEHPNKNDIQHTQLKGINNNINNYPFNEYTKVFDELNKMLVVLNKE